MNSQTRRLLTGRIVVLRIVIAIMISLAISTAVLIVVLRFVHWFRPNQFRLPLKSAVPLILIGTAFACLQFTVPRTRAQIVLGLLVSCGFVLWGTEQFLSDHSTVALIDDIIVFFFVLDLTIVIYGHLKLRKNAVATELPLDPPNKS